jgi:hypothetical protein
MAAGNRRGAAVPPGRYQGQSSPVVRSFHSGAPVAGRALSGKSYNTIALKHKTLIGNTQFVDCVKRG